MERVKLPARFDHNRGHVCFGKVVKVTPTHNNGEVDTQDDHALDELVARFFRKLGSA